MARSLTPGQRVAASLIAFGVQVAPTAYVVATGTVPPWARWTLGTFLAVWLLMKITAPERDAK